VVAVSIATPLLAASSAVCERSVQYILRGQYDAALRQLEGAQTSGASPAEVENVRGLALLLRGDAKKALESFDKALAMNPSLSEARLNRAIARLRLQDVATASKDFEAVYADEHSAVRAEAAYHNAIALDRLGRAADAEQWLSRALTLDASLDAALLYTGMLRERRGDLQGAGRAYLDYLQSHPDSATAMLRFGVSAQKAGRIETAKKYLQRVLDVAPNSDEALEARKYLVMWE
jgi:tetratricopeptide (TPR) repeat protein